MKILRYVITYSSFGFFSLVFTGLNQYKRFSKEDNSLLLLLSAVKVRVFFLSPTEFVHFRPNFNGYLEKNTIYSSK